MIQQRIAVVGDLHYEVCNDEVYAAAARQIAHQRPAAVFQLGDQGGYSHCGTWTSFEEGRAFLDRIGQPAYTLIGNHDLEGPDFETDQDSVAAWCRAFGVKRPYRTVELGDALGICLSSTGFRDNAYCSHEVRIDRQQMDWFRATLEANRDRPTFVFAHAPVIGTGLRVLQSVHLRCPNAWINHRHDPGSMLDILRDHPQIKLWFSGHDHLSHDYADSIAVLGNCVAVHVGVIGPVTRDNMRQSRLLDFDANGWTLSTLDHTTGRRRADASHDYASGVTQRLATPVAPKELDHFAPLPMPTSADRLQIDDTVFAIHRGMIVEYDVSLSAPIGVLCEGLTNERIQVHGGELHVVSRGEKTRVFTPDGSGRYGAIFAPNTWLGRLRSA
jgi:3',5'-cyclic AMP phosphodiesterase CpdA